MTNTFRQTQKIDGVEVWVGERSPFCHEYCRSWNSFSDTCRAISVWQPFTRKMFYSPDPFSEYQNGLLRKSSVFRHFTTLSKSASLKGSSCFSVGMIEGRAPDPEQTSTPTPQVERRRSSKVVDNKKMSLSMTAMKKKSRAINKLY